MFGIFFMKNQCRYRCKNTKQLGSQILYSLSFPTTKILILDIFNCTLALLIWLKKRWELGVNYALYLGSLVKCWHLDPYLIELFSWWLLSSGFVIVEKILSTVCVEKQHWCSLTSNECESQKKLGMQMSSPKARIFFYKSMRKQRFS